MPLSDYTSAQITPPRCLLPILLIGARQDAPTNDETLSTEQGSQTSRHRLPHFERLETLDGFFCKVVPGTGWYRSPIGEQEVVKFWGDDEIARVFQSVQFDIVLQDYHLIKDPDYFPQDDYYYDYASQDIEQVFRLPFRWVIGLEQFEGYESMNQLTARGLCLPVNPDGPQPQIVGENKAKGTKQTKIVLKPRFPNYTY